MAGTFEGRLGSAPEEGIKAPVVVVSTSEITLSGLQTIGLVVVGAGDRVLVAGQTDLTENGIYLADNGAWSRAKDWNDNQDVVSGQLIIAPGFLYQSTFSGTFDVGVTEVTFAAVVSLQANARIYDTSLDHYYRFVPSELAGNRDMTLPVLSANDELVFKNHAVTLANKTLTDPVINGGTLNNLEAQIKAAYESNANTEVFTTAEKSTLSGIEPGAEVNPTAAEIKAAYESNANTEVFTTTEKTKLGTIAEGAEVNPDLMGQTEAENGVATTERLISAERLAQAITAQAPAPEVTNISGGTTFVNKTSDEFRGTTTLSNDSALNVALETSKRYIFRLSLIVYTDGPGLKVAMNYSGNSSMAFDAQARGSVASADNLADNTFFGVSATGSVNLTAVNSRWTVAHIWGVIETASAGTLYLQWAQATADASNDIYLLAGSSLEIIEPNA